MDCSTPAKFDLQRAYECLQKRDLPAAERCCESVLLLNPKHSGAHCVLGLVSLSRGDYQLAVRYLQLAIDLGEVTAVVHSNLAMAQKALGRVPDALDSLDRAVALRPEFAPALIERAHLLFDTRRFDAAANDYRRVLNLDAKNPHALNGLGNIQLEAGSAASALEFFDRALTGLPQAPWLLTNRATALLALDRPEQALTVCDSVLAAAPSEVATRNTRADALQDLLRFAEAVDEYDRVLAADPQRRKAWVNRGRSLLQLDRCEEAIQSFDRALQPSETPNTATAESRDCAIWINRGAALHQLGRLDAAEVSYRRALTLEPERAEAHVNLASTLLLRGDLPAGFAEFEWRWKAPNVERLRYDSHAKWTGKQSLSGESILLHAEQGLGDTLQFCRFASLLAERGARVLLEVQPPLVSLLRSLPGDIEVFATGERLPEFGFQCPLLSAPLALNTSIDSIPASMPYLRADQDKIRFWQSRLTAEERMRVGLAWSGGIRPNRPDLRGINLRRNLPLRLLAPLKIDGVTFYSLQKGQPAESEWAALSSESWNGPELVDWTQELHDFSDTAALIENLDLVITVDTSIAHLAGALNKPVWILNRFDSCWRWQMNRTDSPWYPSARIYRQGAAGNWIEVIDRVRNDLASHRIVWDQVKSRRIEHSASPDPESG